MFAILGLGNSLLHLGASDTMYGALVLLISFVAGACAHSWREYMVIHDDFFAMAIITLTRPAAFDADGPGRRSDRPRSHARQ